MNDVSSRIGILPTEIPWEKLLHIFLNTLLSKIIVQPLEFRLNPEGKGSYDLKGRKNLNVLEGTLEKFIQRNGRSTFQIIMRGSPFLWDNIP